MNGFDPTYRDALQTELRRRVRTAARPAWRRPRVIATTAGVIAAVVLGGTAAASAGLLILPGAANVVPLGEAIVEEHQGTATVDLGAAPDGATNIAVEFWCLSAGEFTLDDGSSITCNASDIESLASTTLPLADGQHSTSVTTTPDALWRLSAAYVNSTTTPWAINANGQTYGVANEHGTPDLVAVQASNGQLGYAFAAEVAEADGTTAAEGFETPEDALAWQEAMAGKTILVPVYLSDGTTKIGDFEIRFP